ncbi:MAG: hypothetical protein N2317_01090 [Syntrophales bacterium]|nr:hypothetical protein [Syntrophales bacterium]
MQALFTLTPAESKRLIAKGLVRLPEVKQAKEEGYLLVARGSTNGYILEELLGSEFRKEGYVAGQVIRGVLCALGQSERTKPVVFYRGQVLEVEPGEVLDKLGPGDVLLKGGNAIDAQGNIGVLMASPTGGTMGQFYMAMKARGLQIIFPVGLEKLIPSVPLAALYGGIANLSMTIGASVGIACISDGRAFTELEAIDVLFGLNAVHVASGGWGGAEGAVTLIVEGQESDVKKCIRFIEEKIKGEPPLTALKSPCQSCRMVCNFRGKVESELPPYLRG